jgi:glucuronokinase
MFDRVLIVSSAAKFVFFEEWMAERARGFPADRLLNDGSWSNEERLGAVADIQFALEQGKVDSDVCIVAGDTLFDASFDLSAVYQAFQSHTDGDMLLCYPVRNDAEVRKRGILEVDADNVVTAFLEKPDPAATLSRLACPAFYLFRRASLPLIAEFLAVHAAAPLEDRDTPGRLVQWLVGRGHRFYAHRIGGRFDIGSLDEYCRALDAFAPMPSPSVPPPPPPRQVLGRAYARAGLLGNPSDGFGGRTVAVALDNYCAEVRVRASGDGRVVLQPHPLFDPGVFASMGSLRRRCTVDGCVCVPPWGSGVRGMADWHPGLTAACGCCGQAVPSSPSLRARQASTHRVALC